MIAPRSTVGVPVLSDGHVTEGTKYGDEVIKLFVGPGGRHGIIGDAFADAAIAESLKSLVPGKRVLDVGCGVGDWCCLAAQYGAKSVDGFDIQPEMVKLAKQATSHLQDMVHIQVGDVADMPYDDNSFDVAISLFVTCNLSPKVYAKHFTELYRVLAPGGKAVLLFPDDWCHIKLYTRIDADPAIVEDEITQILSTVPRYPTTAQVTEAFKNARDILIACLMVDQNGKLFHVTAKSASKITNGQPMWRKTELITFPNFFYSDQSNVEHLHSAGFHIDQIANYCTDERRLAYNKKKSAIPLSKEFVSHPPAMVHYVSKPIYQLK